MTERWLFKSAGRTASHCLIGLCESAGYTACWTETHRTDQDRAPVLSEPGPQVWYDHQRGWPNPEQSWHTVLIRSRDLHHQVMSKILSQHTQEFTFFTDRDIEPIPVTLDTFRWTADFVWSCESEWLNTAPGPLQQVFREDILADARAVLHSIGITVPSTARSRFQINPRPLHTLCTNWAETQSWPLPTRDI
jgi:hypothetical protein